MQGGDDDDDDDEEKVEATSFSFATSVAALFSGENQVDATSSSRCAVADFHRVTVAFALAITAGSRRPPSISVRHDTPTALSAPHSAPAKSVSGPTSV